MPRVILFDFDGPLANSLEKHIDFCLRINNKYGNQFTLPAAHQVDAWKPLTGFPMHRFLANIGFSEEEALRIHKNEYIEEFGDQKKNPPPLYPGTTNLIVKLKTDGYQLGIVSMNHQRNILPALKWLADYFDVIYTYDEFPEKPAALIAACEFFKIDVASAVYIGDSFKDYEAARAANMPFIGVTYGWQITGLEPEFPSAESPAELESMLYS